MELENLRISLAGARRRLRSPKWRAVLSLSLVGALVLGGLGLSGAGAAETPPGRNVRSALELDGNVVEDAATQPDWASLFTGGATAGSVPVPASLPSGYSAATFRRDFVPGGNADTSTFATGSKDTLDITPGWQCTASNNVGDKVDILNSYAVIYQEGAGKDIIVYYGLERASNNGAGNVGFWLLQDPTVACDAANGTTAFTGNHEDGDVLVVSEFSVGGTISTIKVFTWKAGAPNNLELVADLNTPEPNCLSTATGVSTKACAIVNGASLFPNGAGAADDGLISTPWLTQPQASTLPKKLPGDFVEGHTLAASEFYEGGLNLSQLLTNVGCFAKFVPNTRSSPSETATLFDFAVANFQSCATTVTTTASATNNQTVPATVNDSAVLAGGAEPVGGTLTFKLYGPDDATCATAIFHGTLAVSGNGTYSTTSANLVTVSGSRVVTVPGTYRWIASYGGDSNGNQPSTGVCGEPAETVVIGRVAPAPTTAQNLLPNDSITVSRTTGLPVPTGNVTFKLFSPDNATCSATGTAPVINQTVALGANQAGTAGIANTTNTTFTVTAASASTYNWLVEYAGDATYQGVTLACGTERFVLTIQN